MKQLYYIRHGESYINLEDVFASRVGTELDKGLTPLGKEQAFAAAVKIQNEALHFDCIISSPLKRAQETAQIIAKEIGHKNDILVSDLLVEVQTGELEGTPWSDYWNKKGLTYADLGKFKEAETIEQMQQRAKQALVYINSLPYENILVVSHSCFGRAFRRVIEGKPYTDEFTNNISLPHAKVVQLV